MLFSCLRHFSAMRVLLAFLALSSAAAPAQIRIGGPNLKTANIHVDRGNLLKGASTVAIGAFRVIYVTSDSTSASGTNNLVVKALPARAPRQAPLFASWVWTSRSCRSSPMISTATF